MDSPRSVGSKPPVDALERQLVRDQIIDIDVLLHTPVDDLRHIGTAARTAERGFFAPRPLTSCNRRVLISCPEAATPIMILCPHPNWAARSPLTENRALVSYRLRRASARDDCLHESSVANDAASCAHARGLRLA